jgi:hypothetical protein
MDQDFSSDKILFSFRSHHFFARYFLLLPVRVGSDHTDVTGPVESLAEFVSENIFPMKQWLARVIFPTKPTLPMCVIVKCLGADETQSNHIAPRK